MAMGSLEAHSIAIDSQSHYRLHRGRFVASVSLTLALLSTSCGGPGHEPPVVELREHHCPTLDATLDKTMEAARAGNLDSLNEFFEALEDRDGLTGAMRALLSMLRVLGRDVLSAAAIAELRTLAVSLEPTLLRLIAPFADAAEARDRDMLLPFDAASEMLLQCPDGTFTEPLAILLSDRALVDALILFLDDPKSLELLVSATGPLGSPGGRAGFIAIFDALAVALQSDNFDFDSLVGLLEALVPVNEPPLSQLIDAARPLLTGENLAVFRAGVECMSSVTRTMGNGSSQNGMQLVAAVVYVVVVQEMGDLARLLDILRPLMTETGDTDLLTLLGTVSDGITADPELRRDLIQLAAFGLSIERIDLVLDAGRALLEAGSLPEIVDLLVIVSEDQCTDVTAEPSNGLTALTEGR
jgi:hypothetical protein